MHDLNFDDDSHAEVKERSWRSVATTTHMKTERSKIKPIHRWRDIEWINEQRRLKEQLREVNVASSATGQRAVEPVRII